jgi:DNA polymerase-4
MKRDIVHMRIPGFPVAVERLRDSALRGRPVAVCARHSPRSLIFSASPEARGEGVYEGLPLTKALRRCKRLTILPPDEGLYREAADTISTVLSDHSPVVEAGRWGRFYVDMTGSGRLFGHVEDSAFRIRRGVQETLGLASTMGIGSNKLVSGVAARVVESHGDLYTVPSGSEASFLAPLRVSLLPALREKKDRTLLSELNIRLIRQLAAISLMQLGAVFGRRSILLHRQALGIDETPVRPPASKPFVLEETTLDEDTNDDGVLLGTLYAMTERACRRMRSKAILPGTLWLHLRYTDGMDLTRRMKMQHPVITEPLLFPDIEALFLKTCFRRQRIRYMSLTFTDLRLPSAQMRLFDPVREPAKEERLSLAMDNIREKYGEGAVQVGRVAFIEYGTSASSAFYPKT